MARIENPLLLIIRVWVLFQLHRLDDIFRSNYFVIISSISPIYCTSCSSTLLSHKPKAKTHLSFYCLQFFLILLTLPIYLPSFHSIQWQKWHDTLSIVFQSRVTKFLIIHFIAFIVSEPIYMFRVEKLKKQFWCVTLGNTLVVSRHTVVTQFSNLPTTILYASPLTHLYLHLYIKIIFIISIMTWTNFLLQISFSIVLYKTLLNQWIWDWTCVLFIES